MNYNIDSKIENNLEEWKKICLNYNLNWKKSFIKWNTPSDFEFDFAVNIALPISRILKKTPYETALQIKEKFSIKSELEIIVNEKGFLNCSFNDSFYKDYLNQFFNKNFLGFQKKYHNVNIEFVSANPTGYLHLGHLRNAVIGDTLANVYRFAGYNVSKEYYINDRGNQIYDLVNSVLFYYLKEKNIKSEILEKDLIYKGVSTKAISSFLIENNFFSSKKLDWKNKELNDEVINFFINKAKSDLLLCGIKFDNWFSEKKMHENENDLFEILNYFKLKKMSYLKDGALFLRTSLMRDDKDRVMIKENGDYTYFLSDILYHVNKLKRSDIAIDIWGSDHHGYIERLFGSLEILGIENVRNRLSIILIQMVTLLTDNGNKKFSKRLGTSIDIQEALNLIEKDQLRFCFLEKEADHSLTLNFKTLRDQKENSRLYYIQYAHARCNQILNKWNSFKKENDHDLLIKDLFLLDKQKEREILKNLVRFSQVINEVIETKKVFTIVQYLQLLSKNFQSYYQSHQVLNNESYELSKQRIILVKIIKDVLSKGLELCGVSSPEFMKN